MLYVYVNFLYGHLGQDSLEEDIYFYLNGTFLEKKRINTKINIWINIGYICELFCNVESPFCARLTDCNLQSQLYCAVTPFQQNLSRFKICIRHIHNYTEYNQQLNVIGQLPTTSGVLLMTGL